MEASSVKPQGVAQAQVVAVGGGAQAMDANAFANLANVNGVKLYEGIFLLADVGATSFCDNCKTCNINVCCCWPFGNHFSVRTLPADPNNKDDHGVPIFFAEETSECKCRLCCNGAQPMFVHFFNVQDNADYVEPRICCGNTCKSGFYRYRKAGDAVMTMERPGCTEKCPVMCGTNCFVCCACCASETYMHAGHVGKAEGDPGQEAVKDDIAAKVDWGIKSAKLVGNIPRDTAFGHSLVPIGGGGCTPTINLMSRTAEGTETQFGVVQGPTCFGGCLDLCCDTDFKVSRNGGKTGDLAIITKKAREPGLKGLCCALCTENDTYNMQFTDANLTPQEKAQLIGEAIHLDYLFFSREEPLCRYNEQTNTCDILISVMYCFGCLIPCKLKIPMKDQ